MHKSQLGDVLGAVRAAFAGIDGLAILVTGSVARGDFATGGDGEFQSDFDLIAIIPSWGYLGEARQNCSRALARIRREFDVECTVSITLKSAFANARDSFYVRSMSDASLLWDGIGIEGEAFKIRAHEPQAVRWLVQPAAYYLAKFEWRRDERSVAKALASLRLAQQASGQQLSHEIRDVIAIAQGLRQFAGNHPAGELLPSTIAYLSLSAQRVTGDVLFPLVRDLAFRENQGLSFSQSFVSAGEG
jgi:hypothetical protein